MCILSLIIDRGISNIQNAHIFDRNTPIFKMYLISFPWKFSHIISDILHIAQALLYRSVS